MQRFCPNCGTALDEEMMFCPSCGSPVPQPQPQFASQRANVYPQYSPAPSASSQPLRGAPGISKVMVILYLVYLVTFDEKEAKFNLHLTDENFVNVSEAIEQIYTKTNRAVNYADYDGGRIAHGTGLVGKGLARLERPRLHGRIDG